MHYLIKALVIAIISLVSQLPALAATPSDGSHDFDFAIGTWKTHIQRLLHPLTGSKEWTTFDGTVVTRKVWQGRAQLEEIEAKGP